MSLQSKTQIEFQQWRIQTMLLATYFGVLSGDEKLERRAKHTLLQTIEVSVTDVFSSVPSM